MTRRERMFQILRDAHQQVLETAKPVEVSNPIEVAETSSEVSSKLLVKPLKLKPSFRTHKQAMTTLLNAKRANQRRHEMKLKRQALPEENAKAHEAFKSYLESGGF